MRRPIVGIIANSHRIENRFPVQAVGERNLRAVADVSGAIPLMFPSIPEITDVSTDRQPGGLQANVVIDRTAASRMGVRIQDIDSVLNDAFGQRQISTLFTQRNQYRVVLDIDPQYQRDPLDVSRLYVNGAGGTQVPLSAVTKVQRGLQPLTINHQGQFPSATLSFRPSAASLRLAPWVVLFKAISTPFWFFMPVMPAPPATVAPAPPAT